MKKQIKAEMWDRMQFLFRNFYDRMVHLLLKYEGELDIDVLKTVIIYMVEKAPVLRSSFHSNELEPYWQMEDYTVDDILSVVQSDDPEADAYAFLKGTIPYDNNVQIKISVFQKGAVNYFALRVNHMCMDGGGLKQFIYLLAENYNALKRGGKYKDLNMAEGSRNHQEVYSNFEGDDLKKAKSLYKNVAKSKDFVQFPWSEQLETDTNQIIRRDIDNQRFERMRSNAKKLGVTVNDAVMTMVFRAMYEICGLKDDDSVTVSCAIDLRKHISPNEKIGFTNHTAWLAFRTLERGETIRDTLVNVIRNAKRFKRDKFQGLYSLPLLKLAYTIFPQDIAEFAIKKGYDNPLLAVSNIGILDANKLAVDGAQLRDAFMTGAVKNKPYFLMSVTTFNGIMTLSTTTKGNSKDVEIANSFFDLMEKYLAEFNAIEVK